MEPIEISGRYRVDSVLGEGGMGAVYRGENIAVGRPVAVKLVHAVHASNPQIVGRLKQEARATAAIASENVVQVLDAGEDPRFGLFIVMELLTGEDLERRLTRERRLPADEAIRIADEAARGLGHAHVRGVIHRDLKPANVFLCEREDGPSLVKIVDFGIAKLVRDVAGFCDRNMTSGGCVVGTPQYMSPEQAQGLSTIDARTDVYSLGALLFEMLVGEPPVPDLDNYEQKILHVVTKPRPRLRELLPNVDPALDQLVAEMLARDPDDRPPTMRAVRERLALLGSGAARTAISAPPPPPLVLHDDARRLVWGAAIIGAVTIGIAGVREVTRSRSHEAPQRRAAISATTEVIAATQLIREEAAVATRIAPKLIAPAPAPVATTRRAEEKPRPLPLPIKPAPPPTAVSALERPYAGTGISQEF